MGKGQKRESVNTEDIAAIVVIGGAVTNPGRKKVAVIEVVDIHVLNRLNQVGSQTTAIYVTPFS